MRHFNLRSARIARRFKIKPLEAERLIVDRLLDFFWDPIAKLRLQRDVVCGILRLQKEALFANDRVKAGRAAIAPVGIVERGVLFENSKRGALRLYRLAADKCNRETCVELYNKCVRCAPKDYRKTLAKRDEALETCREALFALAQYRRDGTFGPVDDEGATNYYLEWLKIDNLAGKRPLSERADWSLKG